MKICNSCKEEKPLSAFHFNKACSKGVTGTCRKCTNNRKSIWYAINRERRQWKANDRNKRKKRKLVEMFGEKCFDCHRSFPDCVYDFHHLDPSKKDFHVGDMKNISKKLIEELDKCIMLCANCHRIRHFGLSE